MMSDGQSVGSEGATQSTSKASKGAGRSHPKWESDARDRLRSSIRRFSKPLADLVAPRRQRGRHPPAGHRLPVRGWASTSTSDLTTEYQVKGEFADYGMRIDQRAGRLHRGQAGRDQTLG